MFPKLKIKGLCGTFNENQRDDLTTPEGDVEQSVMAFANKWKTREVCQDVSLLEPNHPCQVNAHNRAEAEKYCQPIRGELFESTSPRFQLSISRLGLSCRLRHASLSLQRHARGRGLPLGLTSQKCHAALMVRRQHPLPLCRKCVCPHHRR